MTESTKSKNAVHAAIDLFNRRYILRILWELRAGALNFRTLQGACSDISPSTLNLRLSELRAANLIVHTAGEGYALSGKGQDLQKAAAPLLQWASGWNSHKPARKPQPKVAPKTVARKKTLS